MKEYLKTYSKKEVVESTMARNQKTQGRQSSRRQGIGRLSAEQLLDNRQVRNVRQHAKRAMRTVKNTAAKATKGVQDYAQEYPGRTIAAAAGVGAIIGAALAAMYLNGKGKRRQGQ